MSGKPKTIPSLSHARKDVSDSEQIPLPYDQNRARQCAEHTHEAASRACTSSNNDAGGDAPTDENFVNDDIIEENSHVIPPTKKTTPKRKNKGRPAQ